MKSAAKVGALLIVFIGLLVGGYAVLGANLFGAPTDVYYASFADAGGLVEGTKVLIAGVKVGAISKVSLRSPKEAVMTLKLTHGTAIPVGSRVEIPGSLIGLGDSSLIVVPPDTINGVNLPPGSTLPGRKASPLEAVLPGGGKDTIAEFTKTMAAVRKLLENGHFQDKALALMDSTNKTMQNASALTQNATGLINRMNAFVDINQSKLNAALTTGTQAVADVRRVTYEFAHLVQTGKIQKDTTQIFDSLNSAARKANALVADMGSLVNDPTLRGPLSRTVGNAAAISETGKQIAANTAEMTRNGATISKNGITLSEKANEIATKASDIEDQLKGVLDKVGGFFGNRPSNGSLSALGYELDVIRTSNPNHWRTDINFSLPLTDQTLNFGFYDAFETNRLTVQFNKPISKKLDYRYGIYASKPAVGVDYAFTPKLGLRTDLWDINDPRLDLRFRYEFGNGLIGWLGFDRIFNGNSATIGLGVRR